MFGILRTTDSRQPPGSAHRAGFSKRLSLSAYPTIRLILMTDISWFNTDVLRTEYTVFSTEISIPNQIHLEAPAEWKMSDRLNSHESSIRLDGAKSRVSRFVMNKPQLRCTPYSMHSEKGPEDLFYQCPGTVMYEGVSDSDWRLTGLFVWGVRGSGLTIMEMVSSTRST